MMGGGSLWACVWVAVVVVGAHRYDGGVLC